MNKYLFLFLFLTLKICVFAQIEQVTVKATRPLTKWEKRYGEVKYKDNIYQKGSNWLSCGLGSGYNINTEGFNRNVSLAYHHRFKGLFFNIGWQYHIHKSIQLEPSERTKFIPMLNEFHAGAGIRFEGRWLHYSFFIGPSFAISWLQNELEPKKIIVKYQPGAHIEMQVIFKYLYDLGIGTSLYGSFNKYYQVAGVQLTFYFSNAFKMKY